MMTSAIMLTCECGREFGVTNDSVGQSVKCPECGSWVRVTEESVAVEPELTPNATPWPNVGLASAARPKLEGDVSESGGESAGVPPSASKARKSKSALKKERAAHRQAESAFQNSTVPLGIAWMYHGLLIGVIAMIGFCVAMLLSQPRQPGLAQLLMVPSGLALVLAGALMFFGKLLCLSAPSQIPGSGGVLWSLVLDGIAVLIAIAQRGHGVGSSAMFNLVTSGSLICLLVFLKGLGEFLERREIAVRAANVLWLEFVLVALWVVQLVISNAAGPRGAPVGVGGTGSQVLGVVIGGVGIFFFVRFAGLLSMCRSALSNR